MVYPEVLDEQTSVLDISAAKSVDSLAFSL